MKRRPWRPRFMEPPQLSCEFVPPAILSHPPFQRQLEEFRMSEQEQHTEIERKFRLLSGQEELIDGLMGTPLRQGWLSCGLRVRQSGNRQNLCLKGKGTLARKEWDIAVPPWVFNNLWGRTHGNRVLKTRYKRRHEDLVFEIDHYHGELDGLWTLEVEFNSVEEAKAFTLPEWVAEHAEEVTENPKYHNAVLASWGLPWLYWNVEAAHPLPDWMTEEDLGEALDVFAEEAYGFAHNHPESVLSDCTAGVRERLLYLLVTVDGEKYPALEDAISAVQAELKEHFGHFEWTLREDE